MSTNKGTHTPTPEHTCISKNRYIQKGVHSDCTSITRSVFTNYPANTLFFATCKSPPPRGKKQNNIKTFIIIFLLLELNKQTKKKM